MIRILVKTLYFITLCILILMGIAAFLVGTTPGLNIVITFSKLYLPGTLIIHQVEGSIFSNFSLGGIEYKNKKINLQIKRLNVQWQPHLLKESQLITAQWHSLHGDIGKDKIIDSLKGTMTVTGVLPNLQINLNTQINSDPQNVWLMDTKIGGTLPWQWIFDAQLSPVPTSPKQAGLHTNLTLKGKISAKNQGNLLLTIHPGFYQLPNTELISTLQFKGGALKITLSPERLKGSGILEIDQNKKIALEFQLPKFALDTGLRDAQAIRGELSLDVHSLEFLQKFSPEISNLKGQLVASLMIKGTLSKTQIDSKLTLSKTSFSLPKLGTNLDDLHINVQGKGNSWEANGSIASGNHHLLITGKGSLTPQFAADLHLEGSDFPLIQTNEYQIHVSPKINLHLTSSMQSLSGTILIPYAEIKPQTFDNSISLPEDVVFKHKEKTSSPSSFGSMDLDIEMGKFVAMNVKGLKGFLSGTLHVKQPTQGASINAYGELSVEKGTYKAYGQDLTIQQGQLIFTGGPINNPGINLRAAKKINSTPTTFSSSNQLLDFNSSNQQNVAFGETVTLGVEVTGRLTHPKIQLFSDPAILSQADILSMLVLGRPANQANKAGGQLLLTAISSMNLGSNTNSLQLLEQLKQSTGIDFNVQTNTNYNQVTNTASDSTAFVVGKSLSKRLYLSYNIGLSQTDTNMLTLRYILNKFFSIQVSNSDTSSAIDILYTSNKKKNLKPKKNP